MHKDDVRQLTSVWTQVSNRVNAYTDDALKIVQEEAYKLGFNRGIESAVQLREIQSQEVDSPSDIMEKIREKIRELAE